jgi:hypothetical protein
MALSPGLRTAVGRRAGVASGLLGMLCVLGELCFLLPDLLVTRDALPVYQAHIGLLRGVLQASIFCTFALGALGLILTQANRHGLAGLALGTVALLMGGSEAQPLAVGAPREVSAGLDYFVLELLVLGWCSFIGTCLRCATGFSRGWQTDLKHFFVSHAKVRLLSFAGMIGRAMFAWAVRLIQRALPRSPVAAGHR